MLKVRTYNKENSERGKIICESVEPNGATQLVCGDVDTIEGETDIIDYYHGENYTDVIIPFQNLAEIKTT